MAQINNADFEKNSFNPFEVRDSLFKDNHDPDENFFNGLTDSVF